MADCRLGLHWWQCVEGFVDLGLGAPVLAHLDNLANARGHGQWQACECTCGPGFCHGCHEGSGCARAVDERARRHCGDVAHHVVKVSHDLRVLLAEHDVEAAIGVKGLHSLMQLGW